MKIRNLILSLTLTGSVLMATGCGSASKWPSEPPPPYSSYTPDKMGSMYEFDNASPKALAADRAFLKAIDEQDPKEREALMNQAYCGAYNALQEGEQTVLVFSTLGRVAYHKTWWTAAVKYLALAMEQAEPTYHAEAQAGMKWSHQKANMRMSFQTEADADAEKAAIAAVEESCLN